jgi:hypothetical protein
VAVGMQPLGMQAAREPVADKRFGSYRERDATASFRATGHIP